MTKQEIMRELQMLYRECKTKKNVKKNARRIAELRAQLERK